MYKVVILILSLVCGVRVGKAVEALPETTVASSFQLYQELGLRGEVNFPAFEQALKGFSRYASGQDRLLVLIDYTKPSTEKRIDRRNPRVEFGLEEINEQKNIFSQNKAI